MAADAFVVFDAVTAAVVDERAPVILRRARRPGYGNLMYRRYDSNYGVIPQAANPFGVALGWLIALGRASAGPEGPGAVR